MGSDTQFRFPLAFIAAFNRFSIIHHIVTGIMKLSKYLAFRKWAKIVTGIANFDEMETEGSKGHLRRAHSSNDSPRRPSTVIDYMFLM